MNTKLLLIAVATVTLGSCSSVYKSGQTPDDVYYSPVRMYGEVEAKKDNNRQQESSTGYSENSQIRFGINSARWRYLDDYSYSPYLYGYNYGYYYNPYYYAWPVYTYGTVKTVTPVNSTPRMTNLAAYHTPYSNTNLMSSSKYNPIAMPVRTYNNSSSRLSNTLNKIFNTGSSIYNNSNGNSQYNSNQSSRSYTPSSSSSRSSSSGSSSSGGSVSRPVRSGKG